MFKKTCFLFALILLFGFQNNPIETGILIGKSNAIQPLLKGKQYKLQTEAYDALQIMIKDAKKDGVHIKVISGYRSFEHQKRIWNRKFDKFRKQGFSVKKSIQKVSEYTAIPGTSRHHWGTDVDLTDKYTNGLNNKARKKFNQWMYNNAHKYGFYIAYTNNKFRKGYKYESWHFSYRKLSNPLLKQYLNSDVYNLIKNQGIKGSYTFDKTFFNSYIKNNVMGINMYLY